MGKFRAKSALGQTTFSAFAPRDTQICFGDISGELETHFVVPNLKLRVNSLSITEWVLTGNITFSSKNF